VVDASGNNAVMRCMGMRGIYEKEERRQLGGFGVCLSGISRGHEMLELKVPYWLAHGKFLPAYCRFTQFLPGRRKQEGVLKMSVADTESPREARKMARVLHRYLRDVLPEMRASRITGFSGSVFPRQGERFRGVYILTGGDVVSGRRFADAAARGAWPSEFWDRNSGPRYRYVENDHYEIPGRCLFSSRFDNLFVAGTMISADPAAHASARVSGIALATGESAGRMAAAYCGDKKITIRGNVNEDFIG
ncbi:MAG: FAD-dependent oxidoreductase, partial [Candidatus Omnitrophica bacterium]|nr:FAD-dependent oxidoreductase [Candidatus Omnitrophota bacterium]